MKTCFWAGVLGAGVVLSACDGLVVERLKPEEVGLGVARLTVRNAGTLLSLIENDTRCGFSSALIKESYAYAGNVGEVGEARWTVSRCVLDLGAGQAVNARCDGTGGTGSGKAVVSAVKTLRGRLTGNPEHPVIPSGPDAVRVSVQADLTGFVIREDGKDTALTVEDGSLSFVAQPHLAVSESRGVCAISTPDMTLSEVRYGDARVRVQSPGHDFHVPVSSSELGAQVGRWDGRENDLDGDVQVWDRRVNVAGALLDPDYERTRFEAGFACKADLQQPLSYTCASVIPKVAQGASRLTMLVMGRVAQLVEADAACGFSSGSVRGAVALSGELGEAGGTATYTLPTSCRIRLPEWTTVSTDCTGAVIRARGAFDVSGTKVVRGIRTGSTAQPMVPTSDQPATVSLQVEAQRFEVEDVASGHALEWMEGGVSAVITPRTGMDVTTGACSIPTPHVRFDDVEYHQARLRLTSEGNQFVFQVNASRLQALNGSWEGRSNDLRGTITVDGEESEIPIRGETGALSPDFDAAAFEAAYACTPHLRVVQDAAECRFVRPLAEGAARLLIQTMGTLASRINDDSHCGFSATSVKTSPAVVQGSPGEMGSMTWNVWGCGLGESNSQDCLGNRTWVSGGAVMDASRRVRGERKRELYIFESITPRDPLAVDINLVSVVPQDLAVFSVPSGAGEPEGKLTLHQGRLSGVVHPVLAERASAPGTYDVPTPLARMENVMGANLVATLVSHGMTFRVQIARAELNAVNGVFGGQGNQVSGWITINGDAVDLGLLPLRVDYSQSVMDQSYACTRDLRQTVAPNP